MSQQSLNLLEKNILFTKPPNRFIVYQITIQFKKIEVVVKCTL